MKDFVLRELEKVTTEMGLRAEFAKGFKVNYETEVYDLELSKSDLRDITDGHKTLEVYWHDEKEGIREFVCDLYEVEGKDKVYVRLMKGLLKKIEDGTLDVKEYMIPYWNEKQGGKDTKITKSGLIIPT